VLEKSDHLWGFEIIGNVAQSHVVDVGSCLEGCCGVPVAEHHSVRGVGRVIDADEIKFT